MPIQPPAIAKDTAADIARMTAALARDLTAGMRRSPENLCGYTLDEPIVDPKRGLLVAEAGDMVDAALAEEIARVVGPGQVKIRGWMPPGSVVSVQPIPAALVGHRLNQNIVDPTATGALIATRDTLIDEALAERISTLPGLKRVEIVLTRPDQGDALIRIFAQLCELVIDRLNRAPEKNFRAFLNLIGARVHPPQPARVPLTFTLATGSPSTVIVPARTRVATLPLAGESEPILFETEQNVSLTSSLLQAVFVRDPDADTFADVTAAATGASDSAFPVFVGDRPIEHSLYIACDDLFTLPNPKTVTLVFASQAADDLAAMPLAWEYCAGANLPWSDLDVSRQPPSRDEWRVELTNPPAPAVQTIGGIQARWLRARLADNLQTLSSVPSIKQMTAEATIVRPPILSPDYGFTNFAPLDLSKDCFPFGEKPRVGDAFLLASQEVFARPGATVTVDVTLSDLPVERKEWAGVKLVWEVSSGVGWREVGRSSNTTEYEPPLTEPNRHNRVERPLAASNPYAFADTTKAFTQSGTIRFTLPADVNTDTMNGVASYWLRARIVSGNYGVEASYRETTPAELGRNPNVLYVLVPATFAPPSIAALRLGYSYTRTNVGVNCVTLNDFRYTHVQTSAELTPFTPSADTQPALYLGFDRPFGNQPVTLYAQVEPVLYTQAQNEASKLAVDTAPPRVTWQYFAARRGWRDLDVDDETGGFRARGLISLIGPADFAARTDFGLPHAHFWLRARWEAGTFATMPRLRRVLTNTTWAIQATTISDELIGSSDGSADQSFRTAQTPVLPGQRVEVREGEPAPAERDAIVEQRQDAMSPPPSVTGRSREVWVRWSEVRDFYGSGPRDRHYVLDRLTGELRFGDGQQGLVPPRGRNNIRASSYRTGGGTRGNRPRGNIAQIKSAVPYVAAVTNNEPASGGADREAIADVEERAPRFLRHRDRAITPQDFEDLARESSPEVALARTIPANPDGSDAGRVGLILVPRTDVAQPIPSLELIHRVAAYIQERCDPSVELWIAGPDWARISVVAEIAPQPPLESAADVPAAVNAALQAFLHPLTGGPDRRGWPFGRKPQLSDLYAQIAAVPGVDHVHSLSMWEEPFSDEVRPDRFLVFSGDHTITLVAGEEAS